MDKKPGVREKSIDRFKLEGEGELPVDLFAVLWASGGPRPRGVVKMATSGHWGRDLLVLTLLLGMLFGFKLGDRALWSPDEGRYSEIPREMVVSGDYVTPRLNGVKYFEKPPLFYWLQSASIKLFGLSEWSLRLWTAAFALLGCLAVYVAGRQLFGRRTGLISSVVLATNLLYYAMGRIITLDMALSVLLSCALLAFLLGNREPPGRVRRFAMWVFFVFAALATLTKGLIGIVIPGLVIGAWIVVLGEWRILRTMYLPSGLALFVLIAAPWHILVSQANPEFLNFYFVHEHFQRYLLKNHGTFRQSWFFIPVLLIGFFPWSVFLVQAIRYTLSFAWRQRRQDKEAVFLILWAGLVFLFFSGSSSKLIPYILPMFPPLAILIGRYLAVAWDKSHLAGIQSGYWVLLIASFVLVAVGLSAPQHYLERYSNWPRLTAYMYALTAILFTGALVTLILGRRWRFPWAFSLLTLTSVLSLAVLNSSVQLFDQRRSVKDLAYVLKSQLQPDDEVASYHAYYQDLPFYLERRITVVGWKGELSFGAQAEDVSSWMIDDATFWQRWNGPATIYMVTDRVKYHQLHVGSDQKFYPVAQTDSKVLVSNSDRRGG